MGQNIADAFRCYHSKSQQFYGHREQSFSEEKPVHRSHVDGKANTTSWQRLRAGFNPERSDQTKTGAPCNRGDKLRGAAE
jgi:hypothetical protein